MLDRVSARWLPRRLRYWLQVCRLPPRAAIFYVRAIRLARRLGDDWSLISATAPHHLSELIRLAKGRHSVVEIGTGSGWTTGVLALVDRQRTIRTFDPYDLGNRDRYLALLGSRRLQITVNKRRGDEPDDQPADFLFIDSSHDEQATIDEFTAWLPILSPGAVVVFHDYALPAVESAVHKLSIDGQATNGVYVWHKAE
jgi:predicted O-methyltransferase YrrM